MLADMRARRCSIKLLIIGRSMSSMSVLSIKANVLEATKVPIEVGKL